MAEQNENNGATDNENESIDEKIKKAVELNTNNLKEHNQKVIAEKRDTENKLKEVKNLIDSVGGKEGIEALLEIKKQVEQETEDKLKSEGKTDEVITNRVKMLTENYTKHMNLAQEKEKELTEENERLKKEKVMQTISSAVLTAARELNVNNQYHEDALLHAQNIFTSLDENGSPYAEQNGQPIMGVDPSKKMSPKEWLESMKDKRPGWWDAPTGGTLRGGNAAGVGSVTPEMLNNAKSYEDYQALIKHYEKHK